MKKYLVAFAGGIVFGLGLCISKMVDPNKIMGFLDVTGNWDPSLLLVMFSALVIVSIGYRLALKREKPVLDKKFYLPTNNQLDIKLILGAILFGVGWGLIGYCPGPIVTSLGFLSVDIVLVFISMLVGMATWTLLAKERT
jgi:uncharacterized membrane protein YedE/YeeE